VGASVSTVGSVSALAHEARLPVLRPPRPTWRAAITAALMGWFFALLAVLAAGFVAWQLGLIERPGGRGLRDWPYPEAGQGSLTANVIVWLSILVLTALLIRGLLAERMQSPVSALPIFVALAITGFAPLIPRGLLDVPWAIALLATTALLRLAPDCSPPSIPVRATAVLLMAGTLLLVVPAVHAVRHPLWLGSEVVFDPPQRGTVTFSLRNAGFAEIELMSMALQPTDSSPLSRGVVVEVTDVRVGKSPSFATSRPFDSAQLPFSLEGRSNAFVQLRLKPLRCGTGPLPSEVTVKFRVRGHRRFDRLPVSIVLPACS
jgi:hypothetical protein